MIVKDGKKWFIKSESGKILGVFASKKAAEDRLQQIEYFKHKSDARIKTDVVNLPDCVETLQGLRPVNFRFSSAPEQILSGFIAQEYINVFPDYTMNTDNGVDPLPEHGQPWEIDLSVLVPYLVGAIKELQSQIDELKGL
jgi:hypothetical protein